MPFFFILKAKQGVDMQRFSALVKSFLHLPLTGQVLPSPALEQGLSGPWLMWASQRGPLPDLSSVSQSLSLEGSPTYIICCTIFCSVDPWKQALGIPGSHESPQRNHIICIFTKKSNQNGALSMLLIFISKCFSLTPNIIPSDSCNLWCFSIMRCF